jgi:glycosyltransferase involved in cell wall biosynthesis
MLVNLAWGLSTLGTRVDFIVNNRNAPYLNSLPEKVRIIEFGTKSRKEKHRKLTEYLTTNQPDTLISAKVDDDLTSLEAKHRSAAKTRIFLRPGTTFSERLNARKRNPIKKWLTYRRLRRLFHQADGVITVSQGVADDLIDTIGVPANKVSVVRNPNITPSLYTQADEPVDHPWFQPGQLPVFIGMGGLRRQKDFPTLIKAFAVANRELSSRLVILGQGHKLKELRALADSLGVGDHVDLPGFVENPYAYLSRSSVFVLSSLWEGSPNVLTESLALGIPVVSTDCRSGPIEITQNGQFGKLVPVGDVNALSLAMLETLRNPPDSRWLKTAVDEYTMERSARAYLNAMDLNQLEDSRVSHINHQSPHHGS